MKITLSILKADVGSIGGHTKPSDRMMDAVRGDAADAAGVDQPFIVRKHLAHPSIPSTHSTPSSSHRATSWLMPPHSA